MPDTAIETYYRQTVETLKGLKTEYAFNHRYQLHDEIIVAEFFLTHNGETKNVTLDEIIFQAIAGEARPGNLSFVLHQVKVINQLSRDDESVSCGKVLRTLGGDTIPAMFNQQAVQQENHYDWRYMGNDNVLSTGVDLAYLFVTFWPSGELFKEAAEMMNKVIDTLDSWCPVFNPYKDTLCRVLFKHEE